VTVSVHPLLRAPIRVETAVAYGDASGLACFAPTMVKGPSGGAVRGIGERSRPRHRPGDRRLLRPASRVDEKWYTG
jgi:hypothetical protein